MALTYEQALRQSEEYFYGESDVENNIEASTWLQKYALSSLDGEEYYEATPDDMHRRLAREFARIESEYPNGLSEEEIYNYLKGFGQIIPQGSVMAGCGNDIQVMSLSNCFVIGNRYDSYGAIFQTDQEQAQLMKRRAGVGHDISHLRPKGAEVENAAQTSTGAASFMHRYSNTTREVAQAGRRGALMLTIDIRHPDAEEFIDMKTDETSVTGANVSVRVTDEFVKAAMNGEEFIQTFPIDATPQEASHVKTVDASRIWKKMCDNAWAHAEPGCIFWDRVKSESPADCYEDTLGPTVSTNPCGEIPLCPYDSCRLTAMNLYGFVENPYTEDAYFNYSKYAEAVRVGQRLMDDIVDLEIEQVNKIIDKVDDDPEPDYIKRTEKGLWQKIREKAILGRRTGLGVTALGDTLAALGYQYGSEESFEVVDEIFKTHKQASYTESVNLANERGAFPLWDWEKEKDNPFIQRLPDKIKNSIKKYGRRNISNLTIAPTGTVSLMARTTSGIENMFKPVYFRSRKVNPDDPNQDWDYEDKVGDKWKEFVVFENGFRKWLETAGYNVDEVKGWDKDRIEDLVNESPYNGSTVEDVDWVRKTKLQGLIQQHIDHSISVTVNLPEDIDKETVQDVYETAHRSGCKGITVYRQGSRSGVLNEQSQADSDIPRTEAPSRPETLPCDVYKVRYQGDNWKVLVGLYGEDETPYEVFAFKTHGELRMVDSENKAFDRGRIVKIGSGNYNLEAPDGKLVVEDIASKSPNDEVRELTRTISLSLRHGAKIKYVVEQLEKADGTIASFSKSILRALRAYVDEPQGNAINPNCSDESSCEIIYQEGCRECKTCGYKVCG